MGKSVNGTTISHALHRSSLYGRVATREHEKFCSEFATSHVEDTREGALVRWNQSLNCWPSCKTPCAPRKTFKSLDQSISMCYFCRCCQSKLENGKIFQSLDILTCRCNCSKIWFKFRLMQAVPYFSFTSHLCRPWQVNVIAITINTKRILWNWWQNVWGKNNVRIFLQGVILALEIVFQ